MYYLTNGTRFIDINANGGVVKVNEKDNVHLFDSISKANRILQRAPKKTEGYYLCDETGQRIKNNQCKRTKKRRRKTYFSDVRKLIYANAQGKCALCG